MSVHAARVPGRSRLGWLTIVPLAAGAGALVSVSLPAALATAAAAFSFLLLAAGNRVTAVFMAALGILLLGYMFMGRGFAYLGVPPLYIGETVLILGSFAFITALPTRRLGPAHVTILAFMLWGALRTVPFLGTYGADALRDAVVWGYAAFAVFVSLLVTPAHVRQVIRLYGRVLPVFVVWVPILALVWFGFQEILPRVPGIGIPIPFLKPGDMAVHLAGAAAFVLAGLYPRHGWRGMIEPLLWMAWLAGVAIVASVNRGGMLAVASVSTLILFIRSLGRWVTAGLVALLVLGVVGATDLELDTGQDRSISVDQLALNIQSIVFELDDRSLSGSREWRQEWWDTIVDYTVSGPHFWDGKGYGINLADDDGFQVGDGSLRAPHNAHLNLLARGGVPGFALWVAVQVAFLVTMVRAARVAARTGRRLWLGVLGWVFVYWLAAVVNMTFDVYLEGPQGGILFWSLVGFGLAVAACIHETGENGDGTSSDEREGLQPRRPPGGVRPSGPVTQRV